ncbi:MAG: DUF2474 family protein [Dongiaceae bacterium]
MSTGSSAARAAPEKAITSTERHSDSSGAPKRRGLQRVGWFLLIWVGGVAAVGAVAYGLKALLGIL